MKRMAERIGIEAFRRRLSGANRILFTAGQIEGLIERFGLPAGFARSRKLELTSYAARHSSSVAPVIKATDHDRTFTFTISTPTVDRAGDTIAINGWRLASYRKNPVVLWSHNGNLLPIGRSTQVWTAGSQLRAA